MEELKQQPVQNQAKQAVVALAPAPSMSNDAEQIKKRLAALKQLHNQGIITDKEYQQKRQAILNDI